VSLLLVAAALVLLRLALRRPDLASLAAPAALLLCLFAGLTLPDLDHPLPFDHRSAVTHSVAPALLACIRKWLLPAAAGLALGIALHLAADFFPNAMIGFATVKLPFAGSIGAWPSYAWIGINALVSACLGGWLLQTQLRGAKIRLAAAGAAGATGLWYLLRVDGGWWALAALAAVASLALWVRRLRR
jgi:hypothetical protein